MNNNIVRVWKDEFYRQSLSAEERAQLPENPVGELELTDAELERVFAAGGRDEDTRNYHCHTHNSECIHPHFSYGYDNDDCKKSYRYDTCYHFNTYHNDKKDCHPYLTRDQH